MSVLFPLATQTGGKTKTGNFGDGQRSLFWVADFFVHKQKPKHSKDDFPCLLLPSTTEEKIKALVGISRGLEAGRVWPVAQVSIYIYI